MKIDCSECAMYRSEHCDDCLVTALLRPPAGAVEWDEDLEAPLEALAGGGLIPVLKFKARAKDNGSLAAEAGGAAP